MAEKDHKEACEEWDGSDGDDDEDMGHGHTWHRPWHTGYNLLLMAGRVDGKKFNIRSVHVGMTKGKDPKDWYSWDPQGYSDKVMQHFMCFLMAADAEPSAMPTVPETQDARDALLEDRPGMLQPPPPPTASGLVLPPPPLSLHSGSSFSTQNDRRPLINGQQSEKAPTDRTLMAAAPNRPNGRSVADADILGSLFGSTLCTKYVQEVPNARARDLGLHHGAMAPQAPYQLTTTSEGCHGAARTALRRDTEHYPVPKYWDHDYRVMWTVVLQMCLNVRFEFQEREDILRCRLYPAFGA
ncbi:hypothetical protein C8R44DRAFT_739751 [Mycena epipterygia]|nr:hypothetical protein C8R44DRAFT_739751 [Mycena epipterygia]